MTIIAHPLTQLDGSPQYTASDYRKSVNALLLPSDGTAFGSVQGVRAGSPSPLMTINGTTVTVKAHAGVLCPWAGVGAYTYEMDTDTSVAVTDTTGTYKIALVLSDPSQSHGTIPGLALQSFPGTTADSAIQGLVLGQIAAGAASDLAPRILQQTLISVSTLSTLQTIPGVEGQRAMVTSDGTSTNNGEYRYTSGKWLAFSRTGGVLRTSASSDLGVGIGGSGNGAAATFSIGAQGFVTVDVYANYLRMDGNAAGNLQIMLDGAAIASTTRRLFNNRSVSIVTASPSWRFTVPCQPGSHSITVNLSVDSASANAIYIPATFVQVLDA
ncbi:hypothetical protein BPY_06730 [Bifidobacterium psychraerophilum]|uniref:hypothetical protein n=1 Tax=Bifidobacterium psychraerophilum TaxID=218140 RepID=UPI003114AA0F